MLYSSIIEIEESAVGSVDIRVFGRCLCMRGVQAVFAIILIICAVVSLVIEGWWLSEWTETPANEQTDFQVGWICICKSDDF